MGTNLTWVTAGRGGGKFRGRGRSALLGAVVAAVCALSSSAAAVTPPQIHTVAGGGSCDPSVAAAASGGTCDNVGATSVAIATAGDVAALPGGGFLYVDSNPGYNLVRAVSPSGKVTTLAGMPPSPNGGANADAPDGTPAVSSWLGGPVAVAPLPDGGFLITEYDSSVIRMVSPGPPGVATIITIAGTGAPGFNGAVGRATSLQLSYPTEAEPLPDGRVLIADAGNNLIRVLSSAAPGATMTTIAGGGSCDDVAASCEGTQAGGVKLNHPVSVSPVQGGAGGYLVAEDDGGGVGGANAIRQISQISPSGTFTTMAGMPSPQGGYGGDGGPAVFARLNNPGRVLATSGGGFLIADTDNERVRAVSPAGTITTIAGNGAPAYAGDGGPATSASTFGPVGVSPTPDGGLLIADKSDSAIREITIPPTTSIILSPPSPNGANGWYVGTVHATVSGPSGTSTSCDLDLTAPPTVFDELDSPCPFSGSGTDITGDGVHVLYAASINSFGDKETPISVTIRIDATSPTVACVGKPSFVAGARDQRVSATVADAISGPRQSVVSAAANTAKVGVRSATLFGENIAGVSSSARCEYTVVAQKMRPVPTLKSAFSLSRATTGVRRLVVSHVPARAAVNLICRGAGCPFRSAGDVTGALCAGKPCRATAPPRRARRRIDLTAVFAQVSLGAGARLTIDVTRVNTVGRVWLFTMRAGKNPAHRVGCLAPGSSVVGRDCRAGP